MPLPLHHFTAEEQAQSLSATLDQHPESGKQGVWIFVYGLLAKEPPFTYTESRIVILDDFQRFFNLADPVNRGTPEHPGRTLGLAAGGRTAGVAYFLPAEHVEEGLKAVWKQEVAVPFYIPSWLTIEGQQMLVMVNDPASPAIAVESLDETAKILQTAQGAAGTNQDYLQDVRSAFKAYGVADDYLEAVNSAIAA